MEEEEALCRVCRCEGDADDPLRMPCRCSGSVQLIHESCLEAWLQRSGRQNCELCGYRYKWKPVFAPDAPRVLPKRELLRALGKWVGSRAGSVLYWALAAVTYLGVVPILASWQYRLWVLWASFYDDGPLFSVRLTTPRLLLQDAVCGLLIIAFLVGCIAANTSIVDTAAVHARAFAARRRELRHRALALLVRGPAAPVAPAAPPPPAPAAAAAVVAQHQPAAVPPPPQPAQAGVGEAAPAADRAAAEAELAEAMRVAEQLRAQRAAQARREAEGRAQRPAAQDGEPGILGRILAYLSDRLEAFGGLNMVFFGLTSVRTATGSLRPAAYTATVLVGRAAAESWARMFPNTPRIPVAQDTGVTEAGSLVPVGEMVGDVVVILIVMVGIALHRRQFPRGWLRLPREDREWAAAGGPEAAAAARTRLQRLQEAEYAHRISTINGLVMHWLGLAIAAVLFAGAPLVYGAPRWVIQLAAYVQGPEAVALRLGLQPAECAGGFSSSSFLEDRHMVVPAMMLLLELLSGLVLKYMGMTVLLMFAPMRRIDVVAERARLQLEAGMEERAQLRAALAAARGAAQGAAVDAALAPALPAVQLQPQQQPAPALEPAAVAAAEPVPEPASADGGAGAATATAAAATAAAASEAEPTVVTAPSAQTATTAVGNAEEKDENDGWTTVVDRRKRRPAGTPAEGAEEAAAPAPATVRPTAATEQPAAHHRPVQPEQRPEVAQPVVLRETAAPPPAATAPLPAAAAHNDQPALGAAAAADELENADAEGAAAAEEEAAANVEDDAAEADDAADGEAADRDEAAAAVEAELAAAGIDLDAMDDGGGEGGPFFAALGLDQPWYVMLEHAFFASLVMFAAMGLFIGLPVLSTRSGLRFFRTRRWFTLLFDPASFFSWKHYPSAYDPVLTSHDIIFLMKGYSSTLVLFLAMAATNEVSRLLLVFSLAAVREVRAAFRAGPVASMLQHVSGALRSLLCSRRCNRVSREVGRWCGKVMPSAIPAALAEEWPLVEIRGIGEDGLKLGASIAMTRLAFHTVLRYVVIPLAVGLLLDAFTMPLMGASLIDRVAAAVHYPLSFLLTHWLLGLCTAILTTTTIMSLRDILHYNLLAKYTLPARPIVSLRLLAFQRSMLRGMIGACRGFALIVLVLTVLVGIPAHYLAREAASRQHAAAQPTAALPVVHLSGWKELPAWYTAMRGADAGRGTITVLSASCVPRSLVGAAPLSAEQAAALPHIPGEPTCADPASEVLSLRLFVHAMIAPQQGVSVLGAVMGIYDDGTAPFEVGDPFSERAAPPPPTPAPAPPTGPATMTEEAEQSAPAEQQDDTVVEAEATDNASGQHWGAVVGKLWFKLTGWHAPEALINWQFPLSDERGNMLGPVLRMSAEIIVRVLNGAVRAVTDLEGFVDQLLYAGLEGADAGGNSDADSEQPSGDDGDESGSPSAARPAASGSGASDGSDLVYRSLVEAPYFNLSVFAGSREYALLAPAVWSMVTTIVRQANGSNHSASSTTSAPHKLWGSAASVPVGLPPSLYLPHAYTLTPATNNKEESVADGAQSDNTTTEQAEATLPSADASAEEKGMPEDSGPAPGTRIEWLWRTMPVLKFNSLVARLEDYDEVVVPDTASGAAVQPAAEAAADTVEDEEDSPVFVTLFHKLHWWRLHSEGLVKIFAHDAPAPIPTQAAAPAADTSSNNSAMLSAAGEADLPLAAPSLANEGVREAPQPEAVPYTSIYSTFSRFPDVPQSQAPHLNGWLSWLLPSDAGATAGHGDVSSLWLAREAEEQQAWSAGAYDGVPTGFKPPAPNLASTTARNSDSTSAGSSTRSVSDILLGSIELSGPNAGKRICRRLNITAADFFSSISRDSGHYEGHQKVGGKRRMVDAGTSNRTSTEAEGESGAASERKLPEGAPPDALRVYHSYHVESATGLVVDCGLTPAPAETFAGLMPPSTAALVLQLVPPADHWLTAPLTATAGVHKTDTAAWQLPAPAATVSLEWPLPFAGRNATSIFDVASVELPTWATHALQRVSAVMADARDAAIATGARIDSLSYTVFSTIARHTLPEPDPATGSRFQLAFYYLPWQAPLAALLLLVVVIWSLEVLHSYIWAGQVFIAERVAAVFGLRRFLLPPKETLRFLVHSYGAEPRREGKQPRLLAPREASLDLTLHRHVDSTPGVGSLRPYKDSTTSADDPLISMGGWVLDSSVGPVDAGAAAAGRWPALRGAAMAVRTPDLQVQAGRQLREQLGYYVAIKAVNTPPPVGVVTGTSTVTAAAAPAAAASSASAGAGGSQPSAGAARDFGRDADIKAANVVHLVASVTGVSPAQLLSGAGHRSGSSAAVQRILQALGPAATAAHAVAPIDAAAGRSRLPVPATQAGTAATASTTLPAWAAEGHADEDEEAAEEEQGAVKQEAEEQPSPDDADVEAEEQAEPDQADAGHEDADAARPHVAQLMPAGAGGNYFADGLRQPTPGAAEAHQRAYAQLVQHKYPEALVTLIEEAVDNLFIGDAAEKGTTVYLPSHGNDFAWPSASTAYRLHLLGDTIAGTTDAMQRKPVSKAAVLAHQERLLMRIRRRLLQHARTELMLAALPGGALGAADRLPFLSSSTPLTFRLGDSWDMTADKYRRMTTADAVWLDKRTDVIAARSVASQAAHSASWQGSMSAPDPFATAAAVESAVIPRYKYLTHSRTIHRPVDVVESMGLFEPGASVLVQAQQQHTPASRTAHKSERAAGAEAAAAAAAAPSVEVEVEADWLATELQRMLMVEEALLDVTPASLSCLRWAWLEAAYDCGAAGIALPRDDYDSMLDGADGCVEDVKPKPSSDKQEVQALWRELAAPGLQARGLLPRSSDSAAAIANTVPAPERLQAAVGITRKLAEAVGVAPGADGSPLPVLQRVRHPLATINNTTVWRHAQPQPSPSSSAGTAAAGERVIYYPWVRDALSSLGVRVEDMPPDIVAAAARQPAVAADASPAAKDRATRRLITRSVGIRNSNPILLKVDGTSFMLETMGSAPTTGGVAAAAVRQALRPSRGAAGRRALHPWKVVLRLQRYIDPPGSQLRVHHTQARVLPFFSYRPDASTLQRWLQTVGATSPAAAAAASLNQLTAPSIWPQQTCAVCGATADEIGQHQQFITVHVPVTAATSVPVVGSSRRPAAPQQRTVSALACSSACARHIRQHPDKYAAKIAASASHVQPVVRLVVPARLEPALSAATAGGVESKVAYAPPTALKRWSRTLERVAQRTGLATVWRVLDATTALRIRLPLFLLLISMIMCGGAAVLLALSVRVGRTLQVALCIPVAYHHDPAAALLGCIVVLHLFDDLLSAAFAVTGGLAALVRRVAMATARTAFQFDRQWATQPNAPAKLLYPGIVRGNKVQLLDLVLRTTDGSAATRLVCRPLYRLGLRVGLWFWRHNAVQRLDLNNVHTVPRTMTPARFAAQLKLLTLAFVVVPLCTGMAIIALLQPSSVSAFAMRAAVAAANVIEWTAIPSLTSTDAESSPLLHRMLHVASAVVSSGSDGATSAAASSPATALASVYIVGTAVAFVARIQAILRASAEAVAWDRAVPGAVAPPSAGAGIEGMEWSVTEAHGSRLLRFIIAPATRRYAGAAALATASALLSTVLTVPVVAWLAVSGTDSDVEAVTTAERLAAIGVRCTCWLLFVAISSVMLSDVRQVGAKLHSAIAAIREDLRRQRYQVGRALQDYPAAARRAQAPAHTPSASPEAEPAAPVAPA